MIHLLSKGHLNNRNCIRWCSLFVHSNSLNNVFCCQQRAVSSVESKLFFSFFWNAYINNKQKYEWIKIFLIDMQAKISIQFIDAENKRILFFFSIKFNNGSLKNKKYSLMYVCVSVIVILVAHSIDVRMRNWYCHAILKNKIFWLHS